MARKPILIAGPTASGKSALALAIAAREPALIINADALQVYANWRVLTACPSETEERQAIHRLYRHVSPTQDYSVGHWLREVAHELERAAQDNLRPLIVGGTGLYFGALTSGLAEVPATPSEVRTEADALREAGQTAGFLTYLQTHDPEILTRIDQANPMRLQRAYEVHRATGKALSAWQAETPPPLLAREDTVPLVLEADVPWLNARIAGRFAQMAETGALDEVAANLDAALDFTSPAGQALGARDLAAHLRGETSLETAIETASIATRQFAKRQRSWFRGRMSDWHHLPLGEGSSAATLYDSAKGLIEG